jgi:large subunit ribosomal protein L13
MTVMTAKSTLVKKENNPQKWFLVDATDLVLGRLATDLATILMGKHKTTYTPHVDTGDFVVVLNADKVKVTGKKLEQEAFDYFTKFPGGHKYVSWKDMYAKHPERLIELAVKRMLPKNRLGRRMLLKAKIYVGTSHPHQAQQPAALDLSEGIGAGLRKQMAAK